MALHPEFPASPYAVLRPDQRWFPAAEELRSTAYEKLLPPLVANIRKEVSAWRRAGYAGASETSRSLLRWWFDVEHLQESTASSLTPFRYYFAQREAVETIIWLYDARHVRDKFDLLRFDASGAVSAGMFDEEWPRYVVKMARLRQGYTDVAAASQSEGGPSYRFVYVDQEGFQRNPPQTFASLAASFTEYQKS